MEHKSVLVYDPASRTKIGPGQHNKRKALWEKPDAEKSSVFIHSMGSTKAKLYEDYCTVYRSRRNAYKHIGE